jgi:hypothetical protein
MAGEGSLRARSIPASPRTASLPQKRQTPKRENAYNDCDPKHANLAIARSDSLSRLVSSNLLMAPTQAIVRKASAPDLAVGLICADHDGNRIRIDRIDADRRSISYHFLNDELRVQEGVQERSIEQFLAEGWYVAGSGRSL